MPRVIGYMRVATVQQDNTRMSLENQRRHLEIYARTHGLDLIDVIADEGYSANDRQRPGLVELRKRLDKHEIDAVIVCSLDRLTRSIGLLDELVQRYFDKKIELITLEEGINQCTIVGRNTFELLRTIAEWKRLNILET
ncbi:Resolvase, N terminal domain [Singulisphaera sp. GP187]|uniref:recombinase family protein n=1 Tax=Singulisphaera sp. GP187 TaxID=1882752 RepID=UPI00092CC56A|nr:recombinase family protein [Singulisphaera sp. GP187]SIO60200.1 Resolvase, N terminal domain [Singulisphaera sp. GP187]